MIISGEVPVGPNVDFAQMQEGQHYSMISEFIHCFIQQQKKIDFDFYNYNKERPHFFVFVIFFIFAF